MWVGGIHAPPTLIVGKYFGCCTLDCWTFPARQQKQILVFAVWNHLILFVGPRPALRSPAKLWVRYQVHLKHLWKSLGQQWGINNELVYCLYRVQPVRLFVFISWYQMDIRTYKRSILTIYNEKKFKERPWKVRYERKSTLLQVQSNDTDQQKWYLSKAL